MIPNEAWTVVGIILGGFFIVIAGHAGDVGKVVDKMIEKNRNNSRQSATMAAVSATESAASADLSGAALRSINSNVDLILLSINQVRDSANSNHLEYMRRFDSHDKRLEALEKNRGSS